MEASRIHRFHVPRWVALLLAAVAAVLVPWIVYLSYSLPSHHVSNHWQFAWSGFDVALVCAILATAIGLIRGYSWASATAGAAGALLLADAWFDIVLAHGPGERLEAVTEAVLAELPLALLCLWIAVATERGPRALWMRSIARVGGASARPGPDPRAAGGDARPGIREARDRPTRPV